MVSREALRQSHIQKRIQQSAHETELLSTTITEHLINQDFFISSQNIALYLDQNNEVATSLLIRKIEEKGGNCYLPIIARTGKKLAFAPYTPTTSLKPNRYSIPEPVTDERIAIADLDLVLMPLVAFDEQGNRLGMGGGFYDATFETFRHSKKPLRIGLAYSWQKVDKLAAESWDIPLHGVVTEEGFRQTT